MFARLIAAAIASVLMVAGAVAQDGPRTYQLLPIDTNVIYLQATALHGTRDYASGPVYSSALDIDYLLPTYVRVLDIGGNAGAAMIALPIGTVSADLDTIVGGVHMDTGLTVGDLVLTGVLGLYGTPALTLPEYVKYKPGLQVGVVTKVYIPTGEYDSSRQVNLGGNRWSLLASLPITYVLGSSMLDPELMTFEITPGVRLYGDNDEPYGGADVMSQAPLFTLEGHVTKNFNPMLWASLDGFYKLGAETSQDGVAQGDDQQSLALGATLGLNVSRSVSMKLSYDQVVYSKVPDTFDQGVRFTTYFRF